MKQPEYKGKKFEVLHDEGGFQLVETAGSSTEVKRQVGDSWVFHLCEDYERALPETTRIGLLSDNELWREQCTYCQLRVPEGLMALWKMMNWEKAGRMSTWVAGEDTP